MSQHDYNIANGGGAAVRADINNALLAILSQNSGAVAPTVTKPFMFWYDTTSGVLKMRNAADTAWVDAISGISGGNGLGMVNRIINGDVRVDQRNAGASVTPANGAYLVDRFFFNASQASKFTAQQNAGAVTPPVGFKNYLGLTVASAFPTLGASDNFTIAQRIEGLNVTDFAWGTANAQAITLSFRVYSSLTGTFGGAICNAATNRFYPFSYTVSQANTWTTIVLNIAGDTAGTWATDNTTGINIYWSLGAGSSLSGAAGSWGSSFVVSATGAVNVAGTAGATFYVTGVDVRKGTFTSAPSWDWRPYGTELALCQRYFQFYSDKRYNGNLASASDIAMTPFNYPVATRGTATVTIDTSPYSGDNNIAAMTAGYISSSGFSIQAQKSTSGYFYSRFNVTVANEL